MKLPNGDRAIIDEDKLIEYALNPRHRHGRDHATVFRSALGIDQDAWWLLYSALKHAAENDDATAGKPSPYGTKDEISNDGAERSVYNSQRLDDPPRRNLAEAGHLLRDRTMTDELKDLDVVALLWDLPEYELFAGETGTIVLTHDRGAAFEVEFMRGPKQSVVASVERANLLKLRHFKFAPVALAP